MSALMKQDSRPGGNPHEKKNCQSHCEGEDGIEVSMENPPNVI